MEPIAQRFARQLQELERTRDPDSLVALLADEVELKRAPQRRAYHGREEARAFWAEYLEMFRNVRTTFDAVTEHDGGATLEWHSEGELGNGSPIYYEGCTILESDGEHVFKIRTYYDSAAVLGLNGHITGQVNP